MHIRFCGITCAIALSVSANASGADAANTAIEATATATAATAATATATAAIAAVNAGTNEVPALVDAPASPALTKVEIAGARYDQRRHESAARIVVERAELLRHGDSTLAEALKRVPGITIGDGARGGTEIRLRGLGNGYTQVLLNGVPAPTGFSPESLAPELIERIEIVRTASAELGTQSIAGSVNIILKKSVARAAESFKIGAEQQRGHATPRLVGEFGDKGDGYAYSVVGTLARTRVVSSSLDEELRIGPSGVPDLRRLTARSDVNAGDAVSVTPRLNWTLANGDTVSAQGLLSARRNTIGAENVEATPIGAASQFPHNVSDLRIRATFARLDLGWVRSLGEGARIEWKGGVDRSVRGSDFEFAGVNNALRGPAEHTVATEIAEGGFHVSGKYALAPTGAHRFALGWDGAHAGRAQNRSGNDLGLAGEQHEDRYTGAIGHAAVFAQDDWEIDAAWSLSAGVRLETMRTAVTDTGAPPVRLRSHVLSPILQTLYKLDAQRQFRLGLSRSYKAPTMFALIPRRYTVDNNNNVTNPDTQGNPALRPELAWGLDAAYEQYVGKDAMFALSAFVRRIDDVTVTRLFEDRLGWVAIATNQGRALARGVALEAKLPLTLIWAGAPQVELRANLALNGSRIAAIPGPDNRIDQQARVSANIGADYRIAGSGVTLGASADYRSGGVARQSPAASEARSPLRGLDLYGVWNFSALARLRLGASNLPHQDVLSQNRYVAGGVDWRTTSVARAGTTWRATLEMTLR
jgi:outer membrane receptor protein involved in Fe transport